MASRWVDLLRHGEPEGGRCYRGHHIDDPLSEKGWGQMWSAVAGDAPWQVIISSPMRRCHEFARQLAEERGLPMQIEADLKEVGFGHWEGRTPEVIKAEHAEEYAAFYRDPVNARPQGAEDLDAFYQRVASTYEAVVAEHAGKHLLIVAHAGVNRAIISHILGAPAASMYRLKVANAGLSRIEYGDQGPQLSHHNCRLSDI